MEKIVNGVRERARALLVHKGAIGGHRQIAVAAPADVAAGFRQRDAHRGQRRLRVEERAEIRAERPVGQRIREEAVQTEEVYIEALQKPHSGTARPRRASSGP